MKLISEVPPIEVKGKTACCYGKGKERSFFFYSLKDDPSLGHPKIYINLEKPGPQACGYCGLRYIQSHESHH